MKGYGGSCAPYLRRHRAAYCVCRRPTQRRAAHRACHYSTGVRRARLHSPPGCLSRLPNTFCVIFAPTAELPIAPAFAAGLPLAPAEHVLCYLRANCRAAHRACIRRRAAYRACQSRPSAATAFETANTLASELSSATQRGFPQDPRLRHGSAFPRPGPSMRRSETK